MQHLLLGTICCELPRLSTSKTLLQLDISAVISEKKIEGSIRGSAQILQVQTNEEATAVLKCEAEKLEKHRQNTRLQALVLVSTVLEGVMSLHRQFQCQRIEGIVPLRHQSIRTQLNFSL